MSKNILELSGVQELNKSEQKGVKGGHNWSCIRTKNGVSHTFYGNGSEGTASSWVNVWGSLGWNASCGHIAHQ